MEKRNTIQRQLILGAVAELDIHATAEQVYEYVALRHPSISKATVYRNMSQMAECGELLKIGSFYGQTHYDHNCHEHHHFVCEQCRRVVDVECDFSGILSGVEAIAGFEIENISFGGKCAECK